MTLTTLTYTSVATAPFSKVDLGELLAAVQSFNGANDLTGLLIYSDGNFVQTLEGPEGAIELAFNRISADERHGQIAVRQREPMTNRVYLSWAMVSNVSLAHDRLCQFLNRQLDRSEAFTAGQVAELHQAMSLLVCEPGRAK